MGKTALSIGANTFQYFTRNPRGRGFKRPDNDDVAALNDLISKNGFAPPLAHAPYTFNPASADERIWNYSRDSMREDIEVLEDIPGALYNFHPGCHVGIGAEAGIENTARLLSEVITPGQNARVLIETMAGKGSEVGGRFEELRAIIDRVELTEHIGVCLDTCHIWDAGYDIAGDLDGVLSEFDRVIGLKRLCAVHLNNSLNPCGSHKDRHAKLLDGCIPPEALVRVTRHPALAELPFILETPNDDAGYAQEIAWLRAAQK